MATPRCEEPGAPAECVQVNQTPLSPPPGSSCGQAHGADPADSSAGVGSTGLAERAAPAHTDHPYNPAGRDGFGHPRGCCPVRWAGGDLLSGDAGTLLGETAGSASWGGPGGS